eukprot:m.187549 g.187549  ORF g.187549 m.187549 type:complete len:100 (+) comp39363_c1_seq25:50-349(+)
MGLVLQKCGKNNSRAYEFHSAGPAMKRANASTFGSLAALIIVRPDSEGSAFSVEVALTLSAKRPLQRGRVVWIPGTSSLGNQDPVLACPTTGIRKVELD